MLLDALLLASAFGVGAKAVSFSVSSDNGNATSRMQYGLMFEVVTAIALPAEQDG